MKLIRIGIISVLAMLGHLATSQAEPALFSISDDDTTIYLLGTVHLLDPNSQWRTEAIDAALREVDAVYFEADAYSADQSAMQAAVLEHGLLPQGEQLSEIVPEGDWRSVTDYAQELGLPIEVIQPLQPWLASITLSTFSAARSGLSPTAGVDFSLYISLNGSGVERRFFETVEEQIEFFADLPVEIQVQLLIESVVHADEERQLIDDLITAWVAGDMERVDELANGSLESDFPEIYEVIILRRNQTWVQELSTLMGSPGTYFVAVGAAHVPGEQGVLNLMREAGFAVERE